MVRRAKLFWGITILHFRAMRPTTFLWELEKLGRKWRGRKSSLRNKMEESRVKLKKSMSIILTLILTSRLNKLVVSNRRWLELPQTQTPSFTKLLGLQEDYNPTSPLRMADLESLKLTWKTTTPVVTHLSLSPTKIEAAQIPKRWELRILLKIKRVSNRSDTVLPLKVLQEDRISPKSISRTAYIQHRQANPSQMSPELARER